MFYSTIEPVKRQKGGEGTERLRRTERARTNCDGQNKRGVPPAVRKYEEAVRAREVGSSGEDDEGVDAKRVGVARRRRSGDREAISLSDASL